MFKYGVVFILVCLWQNIHGDPVMSRVTENDSSMTSEPRVKEWISFQPTWSFPSLPSVSGFFRNNNPDRVDEIDQLKQRIDNLESSQHRLVQMLDSLQQEVKNILTKIMPMAVNVGEEGEEEEGEGESESKKNKKIANEKAQVQLPISQTSASTTIDQSTGVRTNLIISSTESQSFSQTTSSEKPIITTHIKSIESTTTSTPTSTNSDIENTNTKPINNIIFPSDSNNHTSIVSPVENTTLNTNNNFNNDSSVFDFHQQLEKFRKNARKPLN